MKALHIAEIRGSWRAWLSVSLAFVATSFALGLGAIVFASLAEARAAGRLDEDSAMGLNFLVAMNLMVAVLVSIGVLSASAQLVVNSRRAAIARLALAGASPAQIRGTLNSQLAAAAVASSLVGSVLALALQMPVLNYLAASGDGLEPNTLQAVFPIGWLLAAGAGLVVVAVLAGVPVAVRATAIPPIEALRQAASEPDDRITLGTRITSALLVGLLAFVWVGAYVFFGSNDYQKGDQIIIVGLLILVLSGLAMQRAAWLLMRPITRAWTALVPTTSPAWMLARHTVLVRSIRLVRTVVPIMFAVGLAAGLSVIMGMFTELINSKYGTNENAETLSSIILLVGLGFLIALAGGVGNLLMMGRQRDAELALAGISGATEDQQRAMVGFEGFIVGGTAVILGLIMAGVAVTFAGIALVLYAEPIFAINPLEVGIVIVGALALATLATALPSLPTLRQPPQKVVARLIAD